MLDEENPAEPTAPSQASSPEAETAAPARKADAKKAPAKKATAKKATAKKATAKKATAAPSDPPVASDAPAPATTTTTKSASASKKTTAKRTAKKATEAPSAEPGGDAGDATSAPATMLLFQPPEPTKAAPRKKQAAAPKVEETPGSTDVDTPSDQRPERVQAGNKQQSKSGQKQDQKQGQKQDERKQQGQASSSGAPGAEAKGDQPKTSDDAQSQQSDRDEDSGDADGEGGNRRRRRRGGRRRRKPGESDAEDGPTDTSDDSGEAVNASDEETDSDGSGGTRRRRRRRRTGDDSEAAGNDPGNTVTRVRKPRAAEDEITSLTGSTRLEAKKQRRREGRETGRRRAPIVSEAEFLARREAVERVMVIRQKKDLTQIAVLEDKVLVEHYVARASQTSLIGNVYLGRVQNVLPSMEAAFIDIGKGRNAVLYAGEVNWDALGAKNGQQRKIESVLKSGQSVLVQVSKDPMGHKGARLTSQISIPGRFLVYVPDGTTSGISRKLPDTERTRLKTLLKEIVPDSAGVIVRTAAEGASEEELTLDVERLTARWEDISSKVAGGSAPQLLYGEPDLTLKVVRDLFTEDFGKLVVSGDDAWEIVDGYVQSVAPDLSDRLERYDGGKDVFAAYRIDEQIDKGLDRKVWLPSGGSLVVDRTEAMTVVDVNTGKFTGSGGNLEETVTRNNLEAAEEIVRQLRLRDIGGIIVVDFIDMVLESNRDLVLRRMVECLGRDRTRHQVAEVTSLGLVQMTRKRIGTGLLEAFSETCDHCQGRGVLVQHEPIDKTKNDDEPAKSRRSGRGRGRGGGGNDDRAPAVPATPTPKDVAAVARAENADKPALDEVDAPVEVDRPTPTDGTDQPADGDEAQSAETVTATATEPAEPNAQPNDGPNDGPNTQPNAGPNTGPAAGPGGAGRSTRPRKRSARREQGPAAVPADSEVAVALNPESPPATPAEERPAAEAAVAETPPSPPAAPRVVTSVRRRAAVGRPAGPPNGVPGGISGGVSGGMSSGMPGGVPSGQSNGGAPEPSSSAGTDDGVTPGGGVPSALDAGEEAVAVSQPHVPVKKKGSRRR